MSKNCYCKTSESNEFMLKCTNCQLSFHKECLNIPLPTPLVADIFFSLICANCLKQKTEVAKRLPLNWTQVLFLCLYNMVKTQSNGGRNGYFKVKDHIIPFVEKHWDCIFGPEKAHTQHLAGTITGTLSNGCNTFFKSGTKELHEPGWWTLMTVKPPDMTTGVSVKKSSSMIAIQIAEAAQFVRRCNEDPTKAERTSSRPRSSLQAAIERKARFDNLDVRETRGRRAQPKITEPSEPVAQQMPNVPKSKGRVRRSNSVVRLEQIANDDDVAKEEPSVSDTVESSQEPDVASHSASEESTNQEASCSEPSSTDVKMEADELNLSEDNDYEDLDIDIYDNEMNSLDFSCPNLSLSVQQLLEPLNGNVETGETSSSQPEPQELLLRRPPLSPDSMSDSMSDYYSDIIYPDEHSMPNDVIEQVERATPEHLTRSKRRECMGSDRLGKWLTDDLKGAELEKEKLEECAPSFIPLTWREEELLLDDLKDVDEHPECTAEILRLRRKLTLRQIKRKHCLPIFNIDQISSTQQNYTLARSKKLESDVPVSCVLDKFLRHKKKATGPVSFLSRLIGSDINCSRTPVYSPFSNRWLKPFIWKDTDSKPLRIQLFEELLAKTNKNNVGHQPGARFPIEYCYVRAEFIPTINALCREFFWPGIDLVETLQYPDFTCIALYKRIIVGFAFLVPDVKYNETYLSFIFTHPDWRRAGIASFMLYHLIQSTMGKDVTLHVSASNRAMVFYQKFGFKAEHFVVDFYERYFDYTCTDSRHAMFMRLSGQ